VLKEHFNFYSRHFFDRALVLLLKSGFLVLYTSLMILYFRQAPPPRERKHFSIMPFQTLSTKQSTGGLKDTVPS